MFEEMEICTTSLLSKSSSAEHDSSPSCEKNPMRGLIEFADSNGKNLSSLKDKKEKKKLGQFMTPSIIAEFMADGIVCDDSEQISILEPAAGAGILAAACIDKLIKSKRNLKQINLTAYEIDAAAVEALKLTCQEIYQRLKNVSIQFYFNIKNEDFLLSDDSDEFDVVIANPPFLKIRKDDPRAVASSQYIYGQPNLYGLFMAKGLASLKVCGCYCFLTPRSWTTGLYFKKVREFIFSDLNIYSAHLFASREDHFMHDQVQQEAIILWGIRNGQQQVDISSSVSHGVVDLAGCRKNTLSAASFLSSAENKFLFPEPTSMVAVEYTDFVSILENGYEVRTGKVVPFRQGNYIQRAEMNKDSDCIPLLWMHNISDGEVKWPLRFESEGFRNVEGSSKFVMNVGNCVILRRFSPKESKHRICSAPWLRRQHGELLAVENHATCIFRSDKDMTEAEAVGLSVYLNSNTADFYLRPRLGNTQVNIGDLKELPVPSRDHLEMLGGLFLKGGGASFEALYNSVLLARKEGE